mgnify:CR=1 FL=1
MPFTILCDYHEQDAWTFTHPCERANFAPPDTGDYSVKGLERIVRIEKKRTEELWGCLGIRRKHFRDQLKRMQQFPIRLLVIEGSIVDFSRKPRFSKLTVPAALSLLTHWTVEFAVPFIFLGPRGDVSMRCLEYLLQGIYDSYTRQSNFLETWKQLYKLEK